MKSSSFLMEIGCEELPVSAQSGFSRSLGEYFKKELHEKKVIYQNLNLYSTPRRIAIKITGISLKEGTNLKIVKGPLYERSYTADGTPTNACIGFANAHNISVDELTVILEKNGLKRISHSIKLNKQTIREVLQEICSLVERKINVPNSMRWGRGTSSFYRPVRWIASLVDNKPISLNLFNVSAGDVTKNHRSFSDNYTTIPHAGKYVATLLENFIIADYTARKAIIKNSLLRFSRKNLVYINRRLLNEVTGLTEWPILFSANFNPYFLSLPKEVLVNVLCSYMRSFSVQNARGIDNSFIIACNTKTKNVLNILHGYEKIVNARLSDVKFFYRTDKKINFKKYLTRLSGLSFQKKIGSMLDKTKRIIELTTLICRNTKDPSGYPAQIALLSKCDLMTHVVGELPELQGVIGCHYAKNSGECFDVYSGIREMHLPRYSRDSLPEKRDACIVSLSDRLDTLLGIIGSGKKATGDKDPYALRRISSGLLRIIAVKRIPLDLAVVAERGLSKHSRIVFSSSIVEETLHFLYQRMKFLYKENGCREAVFDSLVLKSENIFDIQDKAVAFENFMQLKTSKLLIALEKRIKNLLKKQSFDPDTIVNTHFFKEKDEKELYAFSKAIYKGSRVLIKCGMYYETLLMFFKLEEKVSNFLDKVLVIDKNDQIRKNRIAILLNVLYIINVIADGSLY